MRRAPLQSLVLMSLVLMLSAGVVAADESVEGLFQVNNKLPDGWDLQMSLRAADSTDVIATETVEADESTIPFSFPDVAAGDYRVRLSATRDDVTLALSETPVLTVGSVEAANEPGRWKAIGAGGDVSGEIELIGEPPAERMILIRARRIDIDLEGQFPDQLNAFTVEVQAEELAAGRVAFDFAGLSYGLYAVELIAYHYDSHTTAPIAAYTQHLVVDLDHPTHPGIDFKVDFAAGD